MLYSLGNSVYSPAQNILQVNKYYLHVLPNIIRYSHISGLHTGVLSHQDLPGNAEVHISSLPGSVVSPGRPCHTVMHVGTRLGVCG